MIDAAPTLVLEQSCSSRFRLAVLPMLSYLISQSWAERRVLLHGIQSILVIGGVFHIANDKGDADQLLLGGGHRVDESSAPEVSLEEEAVTKHDTLRRHDSCHSAAMRNDHATLETPFGVDFDARYASRVLLLIQI